MRPMVIVIYKKRFIGTLLLICVLFLCIVILPFLLLRSSSSTPASGRNLDGEIGKLNEENARLKAILGSILPAKNTPMYENTYRTWNISVGTKGYTIPSIKTSTLSEVLAQGKNAEYRTLYNHPDYLRPVYDPAWKDTYYRGWLYLPYQISIARHRLFIYPFGASSIYDFEGELGFNPDVAVDYHRKLNFLIYNFTVQGAKVYNNQVALVGMPSPSGAQIISIVQDSLLSENENTKDFLVQLSTPMGYEIDTLYSRAIKYSYLKQIIEKNSVQATVVQGEDEAQLKKLQEENAQLKKILSRFLPEKDVMLTTAIANDPATEMPKTLYPLSDVQSNGKSLKFREIYSNEGYRRPVYGPAWKTNFNRGWSYIPRQLCFNMEQLFVIPRDQDARYNFLGILGFKESYRPSDTSGTDVLLYHLQPREVKIYHNQIVISGIPSQTGVEIITIKNALVRKGNYLIQMVTPDGCQLDSCLHGF